MKKIFKISLILLFTITMCNITTSNAATQTAQELSGKILLQVEKNGEAWYVSPENSRRYYLGRPGDAFNVMRDMGVGIENYNLRKIPIGLTGNTGKDSDGDGLSDRIEEALKTSPSSKDTDKDGYDDKIELLNNYNPNGEGKLEIDESLANKNKGKIFLQIRDKGQAWYINPSDKKRYFLGSPNQAFNIMRELGLGISNNDLSKIQKNIVYKDDREDKQTNSEPERDKKAKYIINKAAVAIFNSDADKATECFISEMKQAVKSTVNNLSKEGRESLASILKYSRISESNGDKIVFSKEVDSAMGGSKNTVEFVVKKQDNGEWLLTNLGQAN